MYGLVLEGGGAKGAYQIGAYKALCEEGIEIKGVAGTSIGAINGALIVQGKLEEAYDVWYNISPSKLFDVDEEQLEALKNFDINQKSVSYFFHKARQIFNNRGLDISLIKKILETHIIEEELRISSLDFGIVTINLSDFQPMELFLEDIPRGKLVNYLLASAYLPAFKTEKLDGKVFLDGGFYNNLPINMLKRKGYDKIIAVRTFGPGLTRFDKNIKKDITFITPYKDLGKILDFSTEKSRWRLKLGYYDTMKVLKGLIGDEYYIDSSNYDENYYIDFLLNLEQEKIMNIGRILDIKNIPGHRLLFEHIIPRISLLLDKGRESSYQEVIIALLEKAAVIANLDLFKIYTPDELIKEIKTKYPVFKINSLEKLPGFIRNNDILSLTVRDDLLKHILAIIFKGK